MITICIRLTLIYAVVNISMRIMGKRQIGEMEISELITAIFISELATNPITDNNIPLSFAIIPIILLLSFEVFMSFLSVKINFFKNILAKNPSLLIKKGKIDIKELERVRMSINELLTELRLKDVPDITQVNYAILEPNGKVSITLKGEYQNAVPKDFNLQVDEKGIHHLIISDGSVNKNGLKAACKDELWLQKQMSAQKLTIKDVFLMSADDAGNVFLMKKEKE